MEKSTFNSAIEDLYAYFDRKEPTDNKRRILYKRVEFIPDESVAWICEKIQDELDSLPRNIGKAFKLNYQAWLSSHSGKVALYVPTKCDDCRDKGILWYSVYNKDFGYDVQSYCLCGACDNWRQHFNQVGEETTMTRAILIERGYKLEGPTKGLPQIAKKRPVKELAAGVGKSISNMKPEREPKYCCSQAKHGGHTEDCPNNTSRIPGPETVSDDIPF